MRVLPEKMRRTGVDPVAERSGLGILGLILSGAALTVVVIACLVVRDHVQGRFVLDANARAIYTTLR